jgi:hypothetical protein
MKHSVFYIFFAVSLISYQCIYSQNTTSDSTSLFENQEPLEMRMQYSIKNVKKHTNDSTYMSSVLYFKNELSVWDSLQIKLRARGNNRRENCYYVPIRLKLSHLDTKGTLFEGHKKLKVVLPCLIEADNDDYVIKEFMVYKLYEIVSPVYFKTRLASIDFTEEKGQRTKKNELKGILIEDIDNVATRLHGNELKRRIPPLEQDDLASIQNAFFQFLIGNTDFSTRFLHNGKLIVIGTRIIPIPYDFDMSGLVNASYAVVSNIQTVTVDITEVTERVYKGYKRDVLLFNQVRKEFIDHKPKMFEVINNLEIYFKDRNQFLRAKAYVTEFFEILLNDKLFKRYILDQARDN